MRILVMLMTITLSIPMLAQSTPPRRIIPRASRGQEAEAAESYIKQAAEQLLPIKKRFDRDLAILHHINNVDEALSDESQPYNAIQKACDEIDEAKRLEPDFLVKQGVVASQQALDQARRGPGSADFSRLRTLVRTEAAAPALRAVARNGALLQEELLAWIKVQELISAHLRSLAEISAESVRVTQQEH